MLDGLGDPLGTLGDHGPRALEDAATSKAQAGLTISVPAPAASVVRAYGTCSRSGASTRSMTPR